jgi:hypothetical protein
MPIAKWEETVSDLINDMGRDVEHRQAHVLGRGLGVDRVHDAHRDSMAARNHKREAVLHGDDRGIDRRFRSRDGRRLVELVTLVQGDLGHGVVPVLRERRVMPPLKNALRDSRWTRLRPSRLATRLAERLTLSGS